MRSVKLVVIGASGVGKSSIRNQYISGRFTTGYRATIGADFITKTLPHYSCDGELVTLQIWDTAGQERFSGLSSAFFRGADAVILMFDVNQPSTLNALTKWWDDFRDKAPVPDELVDEFCVVFVGNKIDVAQAAGADGMRNAVSEAQAREFIHTLIPHPSTPPSPSIDLAPPDLLGSPDDYLDDDDDTEVPVGMSDSIDISARGARGRASRTSRSQSRSTLFRGGGTVGTVTTMHSIYHTPSSSLFDTFESVLSSPTFTALSAPISRSPSASPLRDGGLGPAIAIGRPRRIPSASSMSSAPTITPSLFVRGHGAATTATTPESGSPPTAMGMRPAPERFPRLFFTSAKTGEGVREVFEYVARRAVVRQEYEEALEARTMHVQEAGTRNSVLHLSGAPPDRRASWAGSCCGT